jgi:hypothetical protein
MRESGSFAWQEWEQELARNGRVELEVGRRQTWLALLGAIGFTLVGLVMALNATARDGQLAGWMSVAFFGVIGIPSFVVQLLRTVAIVVDAAGVHPVTGRFHGSLIRWPELVPWSAILDASVFEISSTKAVILHVTEEFEAEYLAQLGPLARMLMAAQRRLRAGPSLALPGPLKAGDENVAAWIAHVASRRSVG